MLAKDRLENLLKLLGPEWIVKWEINYNSYSLYENNKYHGVLYFARKLGTWYYQHGMRSFTWQDTLKPEVLVKFIKEN